MTTTAAVLPQLRISVLYHLLLIQLLLQSICSSRLCSIVTTNVDALVFSIRPATSVDVKEAQKVLFREMMNPLSVSETTMIVASCGSDNDNDDGNMIGFGQIRPLDDKYSELASLYVYPPYRNQGVGSEIVSALLSRHDTTNTAQPQQSQSQKRCPDD